MNDSEALRLAVNVARRGWGRVSPNPLVGCVILSAKGEFLSFGAHERYGDLHAEAQAMRKLSDSQLRGARVFVTLEPCAHYGKQPPCAEALARKPIAEVVYGLKDPNPLVQGRGLEVLRSAGIQVRQAQGFESECAQLCEQFLVNQNESRCFVSLKMAVTLDGHMTNYSTDRLFVSSLASRAFGRYLRGGSEAILIGANTILADDPLYTIRHPSLPGVQPKLVILDPEAVVLKQTKLRIFQEHNPQNIWIVSSPRAPTSSLGQSILMEDPRDLGRVLSELWMRNVKSLFVESGPGLTESFLRLNLWDRLYIFQGSSPLETGSSRISVDQSRMKLLNALPEMPHFRGTEIGEDRFYTARRTKAFYG